MVDHGVVSADLGFLVQDRLDALEPLHGEPICVSGRPASEMVDPGDQATAGDDWRLLGDGLTGQTYRTGLATTPEQLAALWAQAGLDGVPPDVDFATEVAVWFGAVYGSGCPVRLDDVVVSGQTLHGDFVLPGNPGACPDDANPHAYVVAVDRSMLPTGPFQVQLDADDPPAGVPEERTIVGVDLSEPGATAEPADLGLDAALVDAAADGPLLASGGVVEPGVTTRYELVVAEGCGVIGLGEVNGISWVTDDLGGGGLPQAWEGVTTWSEGVATVVVAVTITEQAPDPVLEAERNSSTITYRPATADDACG